MTVVLTGHDLSRSDLVRVARDGARVELDPAAAAHLQGDLVPDVEPLVEAIRTGALDGRS